MSNTGPDIPNIQLMYFVERDVQKVQRSVYTFFDALGDTGGLNEILVTVSFTMLSVLNLNKAENNLAGRLYSSPLQDG